MIQKSKCGCIHDVSVIWGLPMAEIKKECKKHNEARLKRLEEYIKKKNERCNK